MLIGISENDWLSLGHALLGLLNVLALIYMHHIHQDVHK